MKSYNLKRWPNRIRLVRVSCKKLGQSDIGSHVIDTRLIFENLISTTKCVPIMSLDLPDVNFFSSQLTFSMDIITWTV